jgi:uncharacterized protein with GYD domain
LADLDENIIRRSLPFGVDTSIGAVETHASENLILRDSEICDYSDRLLANAEETSMTIYISQGRYTAAAIKGMSATPEDRSEAVAELFAAAGARLISWYLTLGPYDWPIIAEAPDEPTMISAVLAAAAGGSLSDITTTVALTASDTTKAFQRAGELTLKFRSAGRADYYGVGIDSGREIGEA